MFINKWIKWIGLQINGGLDWLKGKAVIAVKVVNLVKGAVESPLADVLVSLTKTDIDNKALEKVRQALPKIAFELLVAQKILISGQTNEQIIEALVAYLRTITVSARADFWKEIAGKLTLALSDGKITLKEATELAQEIYSETHK